MPRARDVGSNLERLATDAIKALTLEVAANLTQDAPVRTGHVRRNFVPSIGQPHEGEDDGAAQAAGQAAVLSYRIGDGDTFVTNNVEYLRWLVLGSSTQAPAGWDLAAVARAQQTIQARYDGVSIDVTSSQAVSDRGAPAAGNLASAYSPFGGDE